MSALLKILFGLVLEMQHVTLVPTCQCFLAGVLMSYDSHFWLTAQYSVLDPAGF